VRRNRTFRLVALASVAALCGCGGGGSSSTPRPQPPDLSGVWAGSWQGVDPVLGPVTGLWEGNVAQGASNVSGSGTLTGDVDCMDGALSGMSNGTALTGTLNRTPCSLNSWQLTALSTADEAASGSWSQSNSNASGTFNGVRIARPGGPRIAFVSPAGGLPGTLVTIVGSAFDSTAAGNSLAFGNSIAVSALLSASATVLSARVPAGIVTAPVSLKTSAGSARSPRPFIFDVTSPAAIANTSVPVAAHPQAVAFSPDGRKLYVASQGSVTTDSLGYFSIPDVPASLRFNINCNADYSSTAVVCASDTMSSSYAFTDYGEQGSGAYNFGFNGLSGDVYLGDGSRCGTDNELFGVHSTAKVTLLDASNKALVTVPVDAFGNWAVPTTSYPTATQVLYRCEGATPITLPGTGTVYFQGTGAPAIGGMTATLNGNPVGTYLAEPTLGDGFPAEAEIYQMRSTDYLAFKGIDSRKSSCQYYKAIGAVQDCGSKGEFIGAISYRDWQRAVHIGPYAREGGVKAHATYVNKVDLNLTRVQDSVRYGTSSLATVVCNHLGPKVVTPNDVLNPSQASIDTAVGKAIAGEDLVACVAMDYQLNPGVNGNQKFVRFYIFGPSGELLPSVNLDGRGEKFMPGSCVSCHGGDHYAGHFPEDGAGSADFGGHMLPYDKGNFEFSDVDGLTDQQREKAIYHLNQNLLSVDPAPASPNPQVPGALTVAGQNLISGWYSNPLLPAHTLDQNYIPPDWQSFINSDTPYYAPIDSRFYRRVLARTCRTCHVNQIPHYNFDIPSVYIVNFNYYELYRSTCGSIDSSGDITQDLSRVLTMPNSAVTFNRYWLSIGTTDPAPGPYQNESTDLPQILEDFYGFGYCGSERHVPPNGPSIFF